MAEKKKAENTKKDPKMIYETPESLYAKAVADMAADQLIVKYSYKKENCLRIAEMLESLGDYKNAPELAVKCRKLAEQAGKDAMEKDYQFAKFEEEHAKMRDELVRAASLFERIAGYKDADEHRKACEERIHRMDQSKKLHRGIAWGVLAAIVVCIAVFFNSALWKNMKAQIFGIADNGQLTVEEKMRRIRTADTGEVVAFGEGNWVVLKKDDTSATLVMKNVEKFEEMNHVPFNTEQEAVTWEESSLRTWLNNDFTDLMFTQEEMDVIIPEEGAEDLILVPGKEDAETYPEIFKQIQHNYWLREQGNAADTAMYILSNATVVEYGCPVSFDRLFAVPEIRISLQ